MKTVKMYKIESVYEDITEADYYSLSPWQQPRTDCGAIDARHVHRQDDGGRDYTLPDIEGMAMWLDSMYCQICTISGRPGIVLPDGDTIQLRLA